MMTHAELQKSITDLAERLGIWWWHDNDSLRNKAGLPDLYLVGNHPRADGLPAAMWREVKVPPDDLKPKQREFGERALAAGVDWGVWTPADWPARVLRELKAIR